MHTCKTDVCKDQVSIPGISMTYVLRKSLEKKKKLELYGPKGNRHICQDRREELQSARFNDALKCGDCCKECELNLQDLQKCELEKAIVYELLRT